MSLKIPRIPFLWFSVALAIRLVATVLLHLYSYRAGFEGFFPLASGADDSGYYYVAAAIYNHEPFAFLANAYPLVLAALFEITGPSILAAKFLNVLAGALTVYIGVLLAQALSEGTTTWRVRNRAMHWTGCFLCFYPSALFHSTQILKDAILVMLGIWALYLEVRFLRRPRLLPIVLWMGALGGLFLFRGYATLTLALSLLLFTLRWRRRWLIPIVVLAAVVPYVAGLGLFGATYIGPWLNPERLDTFRTSAYSVGGSAAGIRIDYSSPLAFLATYSYSFATAMFGPFPWQVNSAVQLIALPEAMVMWLLVPIWGKGILDLFRRRQKLDRRAALLVVSSLVLMGAVALFSDNIGTNTRLRLLPWSMFFVYAALRLPGVRLGLNFGRRPQIPMVPQQQSH
jgi:hypothetical protein